MVATEKLSLVEVVDITCMQFLETTRITRTKSYQDDGILSRDLYFGGKRFSVYLVSLFENFFRDLDFTQIFDPSR
jgi:hypothetical protein